MAKTHISSLEITNDTIANIFDDLDLRREPAISKLLYEMVCSNGNAAKWLVDFKLGGSYPHHLKPGTSGFIKAGSIYYHSYKSDYEGSGLIKQGYIPCVISSFNGLHNYSPLTVLLPVLNELSTEDRQCSIRIDEFYTSLDHDDFVDPEKFELPF